MEFSRRSPQPSERKKNDDPGYVSLHTTQHVNDGPSDAVDVPLIESGIRSNGNSLT
jgi:hypothetical protein